MLEPSVEADLRDLFGQVSQGLTNTVTVVNDLSPDELKEIWSAASASPGEPPTAAVAAAVPPGRRGAGDVRVRGHCPTGVGPAARATFGAVVVPGARVSELALDAGLPGDPSDDIPIVAGGAVVPGAGGDNYPTLTTQTDSINLPATHEQALVEYLATFPATGRPALPTIPATDARHAAPADRGA